MEIPKINEIINQVLCDVLEHTAFMFPEPADLSDGLDLEEFDMLTVSLNFHGDEEGTMTLIVPVPFCRELAGNILGEELTEEENETAHIDAAKEIVNIATGQLLPRIFGDRALFSLTPPETRAISNEELFSLLDRNEYACSRADEYPIIAIYTVGRKEHENKSTDSR